MIHRLKTLAVLAVCTLASGTAFAGTSTYDFSTVSGQSTPATIGIASFSSSADGASTSATGSGEFTFGPNAGLYTNLGAYVLSETGPNSGSPLTISFSVAQNSVTFDFAIGDFLGLNGGDLLTVTDSNGVAATAGALIPNGSGDFFPEGSITLTDVNAFTSITIGGVDASGAETLTIADLTSVPEPATLALLAVGTLGLAAARRRRA